MPRRLNFQTISWFWDVHQRSALNLNPKYQRRSVWTLAYKEAFIDTILRQYPAPAIFLFEEIENSGRTIYHVVDGKQRLTTIFDFAQGSFPVSDSFIDSSIRGKYFDQLDPQTRTNFWSYQLAVDYLPSSDEALLRDIFERINKNIAKLSPQELRHARLDGYFIRAAEELTKWFADQMPRDLPRIPVPQRNQMKDVEFTAQLLLYLEHGPKSHSQDELDEAFAERDESWPKGSEIQHRFREIVTQLSALFRGSQGVELAETRIHNLADFYSLYGAIDAVKAVSPPVNEWQEKLLRFVRTVDDDEGRASVKDADRYYKAARSNSNDQGPRQERIEILSQLLRAPIGTEEKP